MITINGFRVNLKKRPIATTLGKKQPFNDLLIIFLNIFCPLGIAIPDNPDGIGSYLQHCTQEHIILVHILPNGGHYSDWDI